MNLPNKLTVTRVILVPVFLLFYFCTAIPCNYLLALIMFVSASVTDALDGHIARSRNLITNFGKFLDPLADKVLVMAALACFSYSRMIHALPFIIIVAREFMVSGLRLVVANHGTVVAAGFLGKVKTAFTMVAIVAILVYQSVSADFNWFGLPITETVDGGIRIALNALIWIAAVLTVLSGYTYLKAYWKHINPDE